MDFSTIDDAVEALAKFAVYRQSVPISQEEKQALAKGDVLGATRRVLEKFATPAAMAGAGAMANMPQEGGGMLDWLRGAHASHPELTSTIIGGLGGLGVGGLGTMAMNATREERDKRSPWHGALMGGLAGAGLGLGYGVVPKAWEQLNKPKDQTVDAVSEAVSRQRGPGVIGSAWNWLGENTPISRYAVPAVGAADAALSNQRLRLGERPVAIPSLLGKTPRIPLLSGVPGGYVRPQMSTRIEDLTRGAESGSAVPPEIRAAISGTSPSSVSELNSQMPRPPRQSWFSQTAANASGASTPPAPSGTVTPWSTPGQPQSVADLLARNNSGSRSLPPEATVLSLPGGQTLTARGQRSMTEAGFHTNNPGSPGLRRPFFGGESKPIGTTTGRWLGRAGYAAGIPLLEWLGHRAIQGVEDRDLINRFLSNQR